MKITCVLFGLSLLLAYAHAGPIVKRETESDDLSPLNEVYVVEADDDQAVDGERTDRDKRKIGVVKLGISNGILNFVFGKLDSFIDSKTKALSDLDEANKVKNAAFGIDAKQSATSKFISELIAQKIQAASGSVGPVLHSAQTFFSNAKQGLIGATVSKLAPLSSIVSGLSAGSAAKTESHDHDSSSGHNGGSTGQILANVLSAKLGSLSSLSQNHNGGSSHSSGSTGESGVGVNLGAYANVGGYEYDPPQTAYYTA